MTAPSAAIRPRLLDTDAAVEEFFLGKPPGLFCGLDTEADSLYSYREKLCLIQVWVEGSCVLVDPLSVRDLAPLHRFLRESELWLHGADYDMTLWWRTYGYLPERIWDTQAAARLLGYGQLGLAAIVREVFGVELSKTSQKANWGQRPLPEDMREYAATDVLYLAPLAAALGERLRQHGRWDWFVQNCESARRDVMVRPGKSDDDVWRIPGWGRLSPRGLAFLRALWHWRDGIAEKWDRPPFKVLGNDKLLEFSERLAEGQPIEPSERFPEHLRRRFRESVLEAAAIAGEDLPRKRRGLRLEKAEDWESVFESLRTRRDQIAEKSGLDPAILASRAALERYACSHERDEALQRELFLPWQRGLLFGVEGDRYAGPGTVSSFSTGEAASGSAGNLPRAAGA
ncbi:MAG TPA: HRDC domain-containing protein [Verrucomicrobiales bacterium]|nr:HRDC domain-containing protein [Verrucomicrobiales bacterium]